MSGQELEKHVDTELGCPSCKAMIVDLGRVSFFGAAGVTCLLHARAAAQGHHRPVRLVVGAGTTVDRVLVLLGLHAELDTRPSLRAAVAEAHP